MYENSLRMKADLYHELGFTAQMMGQHRTARDAYRSSLDILKGQSAASPGDQALQFALAKGYEELGSIPFGQGGPDDPTDRPETGKDPDASTRREWVLLAKQYEDLAFVCSHVGDASRAQDAAQRARQIRIDQGLDPDQRPHPPQGGRSP